jgi:hypothetical protein
MALKAIIAVIVLTAIFEILGMAFSCIIKKRQSVALNMLYGYMVYFSTFEVLYLISIALKNSLKLLGVVWLIFLIVGILVAAFIVRKTSVQTVHSVIKFVEEKWIRVVVVVVITLAILLVYIVGVSYVTDSSYSYACINDAVATGKMFLRDVYTGVDIKTPDIRYALSGYYMHSAIWAKFLKLSAVCVQHNVMGIITILLSINVVYLLGKELFGNKTWMLTGFIILYEAANLYLLLYSNERYFLLTGAYDEMSQIPYILIPVIVLGFIEILRNDAISGWSKVILCGIAGCAVSASSIMVIPATILCGAITVAVCKKDVREIVISGVSLIPSVIYIIIYCVCSKI